MFHCEPPAITQFLTSDCSGCTGQQGLLRPLSGRALEAAARARLQCEEAACMLTMVTHQE